MFNPIESGFKPYQPERTRKTPTEVSFLSMTPVKDGYDGLNAKLGASAAAKLEEITNGEKVGIAMDKTGRVALYRSSVGYTLTDQKNSKRKRVNMFSMTDDYQHVMGGFRRLYVNVEENGDGTALILTPTGEKED